MTVCKHCKKAFKSQAKLAKHEYEQSCLPEYSKTYCRICDWTSPDNRQYRDHLISRIHLNRIGQINIEDITITSIITNPVTNKLNVMAQLDPVLVDADRAVSAGSKLVFSDGSTSKLSSASESLSELGLSKNDKLIRDTEIVNIAGMSYRELVERERGVAKPTARQEKILGYLAKFQMLGSLEMAGKFRIILEKIGLEDADFLGTHIRGYAGLTLEARQVYGAYLDEFVRQLTGLVIKGETTYRGMDLFGFVARITK